MKGAYLTVVVNDKEIKLNLVEMLDLRDQLNRLFLKEECEKIKDTGYVHYPNYTPPYYTSSPTITSDSLDLDTLQKASDNSLNISRSS